MTVFAARAERGDGVHSVVRVWAGPDRGDMTPVGTLTLLVGEAQDLISVLDGLEVTRHEPADAS